jgi:hypothetical protein
MYSPACKNLGSEYGDFNLFFSRNMATVGYSFQKNPLCSPFFGGRQVAKFGKKVETPHEDRTDSLRTPDPTELGS